MRKKNGTAVQTTDDNIKRRMRTAKATHKHTLRICNTHCSSTPTAVTGTRLDVTLIRTLSVLSEGEEELTCYPVRDIARGQRGTQRWSNADLQLSTVANLTETYPSTTSSSVIAHEHIGDDPG